MYNILCNFCFVTAQCKIPKLDIVFVLDVSISIRNEQNFVIMKNFVKNTADLININVNDSLAAVLLFGRHARIRFPLTKYTTKESFQQAVGDIKFDKVKEKGTNTPAVLNLLQNAHKLGLRNDTVKVAVLITDGRTNLYHLNIPFDQFNVDTKKAATKLHKSHIYDQIYAVGIKTNKEIGDILNHIAYPPSLVFSITGFDATQFQKLTQNFTLSFCNGK